MYFQLAEQASESYELLQAFRVGDVSELTVERPEGEVAGATSDLEDQTIRES
jgi:hypothetical protein